MKTWRQDTLTLELDESQDAQRIRWIGRSTAREPGRFLRPIIEEAFAAAQATGTRVVLDFAALDYMNSATLTSVVRAVDQSRRLSVSVTLEYSASRRWQDVTFSALRAFETSDGRVKVVAK